MSDCSRGSVGNSCVEGTSRGGCQLSCICVGGSAAHAWMGVVSWVPLGGAHLCLPGKIWSVGGLLLEGKGKVHCQQAVGGSISFTCICTFLIFLGAILLQHSPVSPHSLDFPILKHHCNTHINTQRILQIPFHHLLCLRSQTRKR